MMEATRVMNNQQNPTFHFLHCISCGRADQGLVCSSRVVFVVFFFVWLYGARNRLSTFVTLRDETLSRRAELRYSWRAHLAVDGGRPGPVDHGELRGLPCVAKLYRRTKNVEQWSSRGAMTIIRYVRRVWNNETIDYNRPALHTQSPIITHPLRGTRIFVFSMFDDDFPPFYHSSVSFVYTVTELIDLNVSCFIRRRFNYYTMIIWMRFENKGISSSACRIEVFVKNSPGRRYLKSNRGGARTIDSETMIAPVTWVWIARIHRRRVTTATSYTYIGGCL